MRRARTHLLATIVCCLALAGDLAGCGGNSSGSLARFQGSSASIDKASLNHWMRAKVGADFRASIGTKGPEGLVSEPADYAECTAAAKKIVPRSFTGKLKLSDVEIQRKCQELYGAAKEQALSALIRSQWATIEAAKVGVHVSPAFLHKEFERYRKVALPSEAELQRYLTERHWSVSDILFELRQSILDRTLRPKYAAEAKRVTGANVLLALYHTRVAKTTCEKGYVVPGCREYRELPGGPPAPNIILEGFAQGRVSSKSPYR